MKKKFTKIYTDCMYEYQRLTQNIQLGFYTSNYGTRWAVEDAKNGNITIFANFECWKRQFGRRHLTAEGNFLQKTIGQLRKKSYNRSHIWTEWSGLDSIGNSVYTWGPSFLSPVWDMRIARPLAGLISPRLCHTDNNTCVSGGITYLPNPLQNWTTIYSRFATSFRENF